MLSAIYSRVTNLRNALYARGVFETHDLGALTISIGNVTTGGTGKTPLVAYVARLLADRGEKVCILTRGYGRENSQQRVLVSDSEKVLVDARTGGDEPVELANKLLGKAIVIADADRVAAAEWAKRRFEVTAFVLDDGFQHRKAKRDLDIVCIDATDPFGGGKTLPAGRLREPLENLSRADAIVITRSDLVDESKISDLRSEIARLAAHAAVFTASNKIVNAKSLADKRIFAFAGIGNPENFFRSLRANNVELTATREFRDHHYYSSSDVEGIEASASEANAEIIATTCKDVVKLMDWAFKTPMVAVDIEVSVDDAEKFAAML